jgi:asparagine synthase (glutamine-hydrolysing)
MPGIVGLITRMPPAQARRELDDMVRCLRHKSSYVTGTWTDETLGIYVGWATLENSFSDGMPFSTEKGELCLIFSGEEYPEPGIRRRLKDSGHDVKASGASYLVHLAEEDPNFPAGLNGRFHGLLIDRTTGRAVLFNDRYGMRRIYYHESQDGFYFAAEAKAILSTRPGLRQVSNQGLSELVSCGCVLEDRTFFEDIHVLPPASSWILRDGAVGKKAVYFQACEWEEQAPLDSESYYRDVKETFSRILPRYFNDLERIGMSLTGGLDTRMVMAWQKSPPGALPCYSFGGMFRECEDVRLARRVAQACRQSYEVIPVDSKFLSRFSHYAERTVYLTDGCCDVMHSPDLFTNEKAADIAPVRMTGNYGGEVLRRVRAFKPVEPAPGLFTGDFLSCIHNASATYRRQLDGHPLSFAVFRQAPWHHFGLFALEQTQLSQRSPYLDNAFVKTVFRAPAEALTSNEVSLRLIADGDMALSQIRTDRGLAGKQGRFSSVIKQGFLEFTFKAEYAYDYGMPHWVAQTDHFFTPLHLERIFLGRHKFYHFRIWYRDALAEYVREILLDGRTLSRPYIHRKQLEAMVGNHLKGERNYTTEIHKVLTLELLHRLFLDPQ